MNSVRIFLFAFFLLASATPALATTTGLGIAGDYNAFIFNDFNASNSSSEGALAVGGNANITSYSVNTGNTTTADNALVVGGDLTFNNGSINGSSSVGGTVTAPSYMTSVGTSSSSVDFALEAATLKQLSQSLSSLSSTGTSTLSYSTLTLSGSTDDTLVVFNISAQDLASATSIVLDNISSDATIVINVSGSSVTLSNLGMSSLADYSSQILFNFYEADTLTIDGVAVWGSVLAPFASVQGNNGQLNGTLIADSFSGSLTLNDNQFTGNVSATPIPGSVALLGTGFLGFLAVRRRKRRV